MPLPRHAHSSYYDRNYRQNAALIRARKPYLIPNIIAGLSLFAFTVGVYAWTINAVSQDDFSDVPIPDAPPSKPSNVGVQSPEAVAGKT